MMGSLCQAVCKCWEKKGYNDKDLLGNATLQNSDEFKKQPYTCRFKFCCFWCTISSILFILIFVLVLFLAIIPNIAKSAANNSITTQLYTHLSNPTNNSICLDTSIQISNTGPFDAIIHSVTADVYFNGTKFATLPLPEINTKANYGAIFNLSMASINMKGNTLAQTTENIIIFKKIVEGLFNGIDQELHVKASPSIDISIAGITVSTSINMDNIFLIPAAAIQNPTISNFTVIKTESNMIHAVADIQFSSQAQMYLTLHDITIKLYNESGSYIGYAIIEKFELNPGYNHFDSIPTYLVRDNASQESMDAIANYVANFMSGNNQKVIISGPVSLEGKETVLDGCINQTFNLIATQYGNLIVAGIMTSASQIGWYICDPNDKKKCKHMTGAYSTIINPLNVPITLLNVTATVDLLEPVEWDYWINTGVPPIWWLDGHCDKTQQYSLLSTGHGMFQNDWSKTDVYIPAYSSKSFFVERKPIPGQFKNESSCIPVIEPQSCCYLTETIAAICRDNPVLYNTSNTHDMFLSHAVELDQAFLSCNLTTMEKIRIGEAFEVNITYSQDWFPLFYGYEVYAGYNQSYGLNCSDIKIYPTK